MKLVSLRLTDFLNHRDTTVEFGPVTVIAGPNNAGKSAIKDAIEMVLTGTARTTDKAGRDAANLVRVGAKRFSVQAALVTRQDGKATTLTVTRSKGVTGGHELTIEEEGTGAWQGSIADLEKALYRALNASPGLIRACIHAGRLPEMAPADQEALLFSTLGLNFTVERIEELLIQSGCAEADAKLLQAGPRGSFLGAAAKPEYGPEVFDAAYKFSYGCRAQAKKDAAVVANELVEAKKQVEALVRQTPVVDGADRDWLARNTATLDGLEKERDAMLVEVGRVGDIDAEIAAAESEIAENRKRLKVRRAWDKKAEAAGGRACVLDQIKNSDELVMPGVRARALNAAEAAANLKQAADAFSGSTATCPVAGIECPVKGKDRTAIAEDLRARFAKAQEKATELKAELTKEEKSISALRELRDTEPDDELAVLEGQTERIEEQLKRFLKLKGSEKAAELDALTSRIASGRAKLRFVEGYLVAKDKVEAAKVRVGKSAGIVERWERLVTALSPGGAKLRAVDGPLKDLQVRINDRMDQYTKDYELAIVTDGGFEVVVRTPGTDKGFVPTRALSTSERLRVGIALQDALAHISGLGFLLVDNFDMLDAANKSAVGQALLAWSEHYDTIVLLTTRDSRPVASDARTTYWVEAGVAEVVA